MPEKLESENPGSSDARKKAVRNVSFLPSPMGTAFP